MKFSNMFRLLFWKINENGKYALGSKFYFGNKSMLCQIFFTFFKESFHGIDCLLFRKFDDCAHSSNYLFTKALIALWLLSWSVSFLFADQTRTSFPPYFSTLTSILLVLPEAGLVFILASGKACLRMLWSLLAAGAYPHPPQYSISIFLLDILKLSERKVPLRFKINRWANLCVQVV